MDADRVSRSLTRIAHEILERNRGVENLALVGIRARGVPLAGRIAAALKELTGIDVPTGALDITLYRDDLMRHAVGPQPVIRRTEIPFSIDDRLILLVDDVLLYRPHDSRRPRRADRFRPPARHPTGGPRGPRPSRAADSRRLRRTQHSGPRSSRASRCA
jgi:hypothetical protein